MPRECSDPGLLKPNPHLLLRALAQLSTQAEECVMVGDSVADIEAAQAAGVGVVAYANRPGKRSRLADHEPDALATEISLLITNAR